MLRSVNELKGFAIVATDGKIGDVEQFYFDDEQWAVRYIVVNTGNWLSGRQVLISPFSVVKVDRENSLLQLDLTKSQVENSPDIDTHKPVSRQMEATHSDYYGNPRYWGSPFLWGPEEYPATPQSIPMTATATATAPMLAAAEDIHLRSTEEVSSYHIAATDGDLGHVEDFIIEDNSWVIRYLAIDTRNWLPGRKVMVAPQWIASIDWAQGKVHVNLSCEGIKQSPEYDSAKLLSREYEMQLYRHYHQPGYWLEPKP